MTTLMTIEEAVAQRLEAIEARERERAEAARREEQRQAKLRIDFASILSQRVAEEYGVVLRPSQIHAGLIYDYGDNYTLELVVEETTCEDGTELEGRVHLLYSASPEDLSNGCKLHWLGLRCSREDGQLPQRVETYDLVEALTFAMTGKR